MRRLSLSLSLVLLFACSDNNNGGGGSSGGAGGARSGGSSGSGGSGRGGSTGSGGSSASGGSSGSGGSSASGGSSGSGGSTGTGGSSGSGGSSGDAGGDTSGDTGGGGDAAAGGNVFVYAASNTGYGTATTIRAFKFDTTTGALTAGPTVAAGSTVSWVTFSPNRKFAYALNEPSMSTLTSFSVNQSTGALTKINSVMSSRMDAVHMSVDPSGKYLLTAHLQGAMMTGGITVHELGADGSIGMLTDSKVSEPTIGAAHQVIVDKGGTNVFASTYNGNSFAQFKFAMGKLTANAPAQVSVGGQARHLVIDQAEKFAYGVTEKEVSVVTLSYDKATGKLSNPTSMDASVNEKGGGSTVVLHPTGKFLFVGSRFDNSIVTFAVDAATGKLTRGTSTNDSISYPREFAIDPTGNYLVVGTQPNDPAMMPANKKPMGGGYIVVFKVNTMDGSLTKVGTPMRFDTNVPWVGIVQMP
ncbi:MAG TPA: beta-propeller fold lactonase family protein [Polyangia bacterium]